jgi:hypothetical protein
MIKARRMRLAGHLERMGKRHEVVGGNPMGRRPLERERRRWVDNIKVDAGEVG